MRLTLRTLLAYLDDALDPQETELLRTKIGESGFATQLVQRLRRMLADGSIPAPSPEAMGPIEEANVISEYLDSTMPREQVAEIERACLESDPHLAEAAACHQILTMVLKKPADVPPELRSRIYELPDRAIEEIASGESFSAVSIPVEPISVDPIDVHPNGELDPLVDGLPTSNLTMTGGAEPVSPVGVADSGVSDAPTRIRQADHDIGMLDDPAVAGSSPGRSALDPTYYGGSIRPSRIAPWLVSLALAAVLLFVLTRIFQPLLEPPTTAENQMVAPAASDRSPADSDGESVAAAPDSADDTASPADTAPAEVSPADVAASENARPAAEVDGDEAIDPTGSEPAPDAIADSSDQPQDDAEMADPAETTSLDAPLLADLAPSDDAPSDDPKGTGLPVPPSATDVAKADAMPTPPPPAGGDPDQAGLEIAKYTGPQSLAAVWDGDQWIRLNQDMMIGSGAPVVCAPTFRGRMSAAGVEVTVVGPAQFRWLASDQGPVLQLDSGRALVSATAADTLLTCQLGDETTPLYMSDVDSVAAVSVKHSRAPGYDPLIPEHRVALAVVLSVQGTFRVGAGAAERTLQTGEQFVKRGSADAQVSPVESVPEWINPPDPTSTDLESVARDGLLEFLESDQPLELALREATMHRRAEVAALAARTLLSMGQGDAYFGGDGILNQAKQRLFWPDHFQHLLAEVDRSVDSATQLRDSIESMDSANAQSLFRLLTGYSQNQLAEGGDEELVQMLASASMAVRVLALENLRMITGSTANFRPEKDNSSNTKWLTRQRRGDIRWQE